MASPFAKMRGWWYDVANSRIAVVFNGTQVVRYTATAITHLVATSVTGGVTATTGNVQSTAGDLVSLVGNAKLGAPAAFATTQPQGAVVMGGTSKSGIAPVGAVATSGAVFASDTVVRKMIADGTASNVET